MDDLSGLGRALPGGGPEDLGNGNANGHGDERHLPSYPNNSNHHLASNGAGSASNGEDIRTLYVVGLPDDIRERELRNLFRFYPAYRGCMLSEKKGKYGGTLAFALFDSKASAIEAKAGMVVNGTQGGWERLVNCWGSAHLLFLHVQSSTSAILCLVRFLNRHICITSLNLLRRFRCSVMVYVNCSYV